MESDLKNYSLSNLKLLAKYYNVSLLYPVKRVISELATEIMKDKKVMRGQMYFEKDEIDKILKKTPGTCYMENPVELGKFIAGGSYGRVYEACVNNDCQNLVIKVQLLVDTSDSTDVADFNHELKISKLASEKGFGPRVIYGCIVIDSDDPVFQAGIIVMERWDNSLQQVDNLWCDYWKTFSQIPPYIDELKVRSTSLEQLQKNSKIVRRLLEERIKEMHDTGYIHGDLNPNNVLVKLDQGLVTDLTLTDFGFSFNWRKLVDELPDPDKLPDPETLTEKNITELSELLTKKNIKSIIENVWLIFSTMLERWEPENLPENYTGYMADTIPLFKEVYGLKDEIISASEQYLIAYLIAYLIDEGEQESIEDFMNFLRLIKEKPRMLFILDAWMLFVADGCAKMEDKSLLFLDRAKGKKLVIEPDNTLFSTIPVNIPKVFNGVLMDNVKNIEYKRDQDKLIAIIHYKDKDPEIIGISDSDFEHIYLNNWGLRWSNAYNVMLQ